MRFRSVQAPLVVADGEYPFLDPQSEDGKRINRRIKIVQAIARNTPPLVIEKVTDDLPAE